MCWGFKPGASRWLALTAPLSYSGRPPHLATNLKLNGLF